MIEMRCEICNVSSLRHYGARHPFKIRVPRTTQSLKRIQWNSNQQQQKGGK